MNRLFDMTFRDALRALSAYRAYLILLAGVVLVAVVLPGARSTDDGDTEVVQTDRSGAVASGPSGTLDGAGAGDVGTGGAPAGTPGAGGAAGGAGAAGARVASGSRAAAGSTAAPSPAVRGGGGDPMANPKCDPATGRFRVPTVYAPPCVAAWPKGANNGGQTYQGVSSKEIVVAIRFNPNPDPAGQAVLLAAGVDDTAEQVRATRQAYVEYFEAHYETYGRKVRLEYVPESGDDEQADRADAIRIANEIKPFAVWGGSGAFKDEIVAHRILCVGCTTSEPIENYLAAKPYVWSTLMSSTQAYMHRAEYIGKRLWGRNAVHAGDVTFQTQPRRFGLIYFETAEGAYKAGVDFFEQELAKYGASLADRIAYEFDLAVAQEQARTIIGRLKDKRITSVVFSGDPIYPAFFTQEATNQQYNPEWIITGSALTDTAVFARTYDQNQWSHAFGVSMLAGRIPPQLTDPYYLHQWHHKRGPEADDSFGVIYPTPFIFFTAVHLAGPELNPRTFRDALFSYPVSGAGGISNVQTSFGHHGIWPWEDYLAYDDMTEIWWDRTATGPDETGKEGVGLYQYVDGGKRYAAGSWPSTDPKAFDRNGAVTIHPDRPPQDKPPDYPPP